MGRYEQPTCQAGQVRLDKHRLALAYTAPGEFTNRTVDQTLDFSNGPAPLVRANTNLDAVIGKSLEHFVGRDEYLPPVIEHGEAITRLRALDDGIRSLFF